MDRPNPSAVRDRVHSILARMAELEEELEEELHRREGRVRYQITNRKVRFEEEIRAAHKRVRFRLGRWLRESELRNALSAPVIYSVALPIALLDLWVTVYQSLCFWLYRIEKVDRSDFVAVDRHRLAYLNVVEKVNCAYCGYATGVLAYAREVSARTEQYWCPIKHARKAIGTHSRYVRFLEYGRPEDFHPTQDRLRSELRAQD